MNEVRFCPECGSAAVDFSVIGGSANCRQCKWNGTESDLLFMPLSSTLLSPEQLCARFVLELRLLLAENLSTPMLQFLSQWGFLTNTEDEVKLKQEAVEYLARISSAVASAIIEKRDEIAKREGAADQEELKRKMN